MIRIVKAVQTCWACPSQWDAWTDTGEQLYLRYRYGCGTVSRVLGDGSRKLIVDFEFGDPMDGSIGLEEFCREAGLTLKAPGVRYGA